jgi:hypothetical protein
MPDAPAARHRSAEDLARYLPKEEAEELRGMHYIPVALLDRVRLMLSRAGRKRGRASRCCGYWMRK